MPPEAAAGFAEMMAMCAREQHGKMSTEDFAALLGEDGGRRFRESLLNLPGLAKASPEVRAAIERSLGENGDFMKGGIFDMASGKVVRIPGSGGSTSTDRSGSAAAAAPAPAAPRGRGRGPSGDGRSGGGLGSGLEGLRGVFAGGGQRGGRGGAGRGSGATAAPAAGSSGRNQSKVGRLRVSLTVFIELLAM